MPLLSSKLNGRLPAYYWRDDLLFELKSCLALYDTYTQATSTCDCKMEVVLAGYKQADVEVVNEASTKKLKKKLKIRPILMFDIWHLRT